MLLVQIPEAYRMKFEFRTSTALKKNLVTRMQYLNDLLGKEKYYFLHCFVRKQYFFNITK